MSLKVLILANLVIVLLGAGVVYYSHNMIKPARTDQEAEALDLKTRAISAGQISPVPMKTFTANLQSRPSRLRYLSIEMNILTFHEDQKAIIQSNEHIIKDAVINIASYLGPDDLDSITGKILLENRIKKQVNMRLGSPVIKQIYFSDFKVQ